MTEPDPNTVARAAHEYHALLRRYWTCLKVAISCIGIALLLSWIVNPFSEDLGHALVTPPMLVFLGCCLTGAFTWMQILLFACPRCGKSFVLAWYSSWPETTCKHCRLPLCKPSAPIQNDPRASDANL